MRLALADRWIAQPPSEERDSWTATIDELRVDRTSVAVERAGGDWERFGSLQLEASMRVHAGGVEVDVGSLGGTWLNREIDLAGRGRVHLGAEEAPSQAEDVELIAGPAGFTSPGLAGTD